MHTKELTLVVLFLAVFVLTGCAKSKVVYVIKPLHQGDTIKQDQVEEREVPLSKAPSGAPEVGYAVVDRKVNKDIAAGEIITYEDLVPRDPERVIARADIAKGKTIAVMDVCWSSEQQNGKFPPGAMKEMDDVVGRVAKHDISKDHWVVEADLEPKETK